MQLDMSEAMKSKYHEFYNSRALCSAHCNEATGENIASLSMRWPLVNGEGKNSIFEISGI